MDHLAALLLAEKRNKPPKEGLAGLDWAEERERWIRLLWVAQEIEGLGRRRRAVQRIRTVLRTRFNLKASTYNLAIPPLCGQSRWAHMKDFMKQLHDRLKPQGRNYAQYIVCSFRFVEKKERTAASKHTNAQKLARESDLDDLRKIPLDIARRLLKGADAEMMNENWDIPLIDSEEGAAKRWTNVAKELAEKFSLSPDMTAFCCKAAASVQKKDRFPRQSVAYRNYIRRCRGHKGEVVVPRDGDPKRRTRRTEQGYLLTVYHHSLSHPERYRFRNDLPPGILAQLLSDTAREL